MSQILNIDASHKARLFLSLFVPHKVHFLVLLFGALGVFSFAPFFFSPVILISLMGLFFFWFNAKTPLDGFKLGLWFGFGFFGLGVSWLFSSMYFYSGVLLPVAMLLTFLFILFLSLFIAISGWLALHFRQGYRSGFTLTVLFPAVWVLFELLRASFLGGYPFLLLGNTHIDTWLAGYAPVLGVWGVNWAIAVSAGILLWLYQKRAWIRASLALALL
ncbi:MAG TPA: apolipoprotein N-acyltransferase, partial [Thiomicrorhabdus sp.]|nr:apolipoprotein N-acyltransferase [Thiomicrorhabdus sp.]